MSNLCVYITDSIFIFQIEKKCTDGVKKLLQFHSRVVTGYLHNKI